MRLWFTLFAFLIGCPAYSQILPQSGSNLDLLQKIQGRWSSKCRPLDAGARFGYQQTLLVVSFTHFTFTVEEFPTGDCVSKHLARSDKYRFILREPVLIQGQHKGFTVDFSRDEEFEPAIFLYPLNIIHYEAGTLRLGEPPVVETEGRLHKLDRDLVFTR